jgi:hypothetical protein
MTAPMPDTPSRFNRVLGARWVDKSIDVLWCGLLLIKTCIEEGFLRQNLEYARYMEHVR